MKRHHARLLRDRPKPFAPLAVLALAALLAGCSAPALKSTPLSVWDDDNPDGEHSKAIGSPEDRVNIWPLLYYRDPALSVLWPLIAVTDEGHAFIPFYEYTNSSDELRLGSIHQSLPSLATFNGEDDYWRVLNVVKESGEDDYFFSVLPLYYQGKDYVTFLPFFVKTEDSFLSPIYSSYPNGFNILILLYNYYNSGGYFSHNFLWPIFGYWNSPSEGNGVSGFKAFPLFYYSKDNDSSYINLGGLLLNRWARDDSEHAHYLWPLGSWGHEKGVRWEGQDAAWSKLLPLYYTERNGEKREFYSLPVSFENNGEYYDFFNIMGLVYHQSRSGDDTFRSVLMPLTGAWTSGEEAGSWVFPIYYYNKDQSGERNLIAPFWQQGSNAKGDEGYWGTLPLFLRTWDGQERGFYSLPASFGTNGDDSFVNLGGILYHRSTSPDSGYQWTALGFIGNSWGPDSENSQWFFPIFSRSQNEEEQSFSVLFSLVASYAGTTGGEKGAKAQIVEEIRASRRSWREARDAMAEEAETFEENDYSGLDYVERDVSSFASLLGLIRHESKLVAALRQGEDGAALSDYDFERHSWGWFFPFYYYDYQGSKASWSNVLWRLYDSKREVADSGEVYTRQRVLWRIFHRETLGDRVSVDAFPFIAYDSSPDLTQFSFLGGFFGFGSKKDENHIKLFWLPIRW